MTDLDEALRSINSTPDSSGLHEADVDGRFAFPKTRLAAYGTLRPGESNHPLLSEVPGVWVEGTVPGVRFTANGYPAFKWRPGRGPVPVSVLTSPALPQSWAWLDEFEGADYRRILVPVTLSDGNSLVAYLYEYVPT